MTTSERCTAFDPFEFETRWVAWRNELRNGKQTKVPYSPHGGPAKADDPSTWSTRSAAEAKARNLVNGQGGGIGIELGDLGDGTSLGGIDLDTCLSGGMFEQWAMDIIQRLGSYAEVSPCGTGAKIFFRYLTEDLPKLRAEMGGAQHGKMFKRPNGARSPAGDRAAPDEPVFRHHRAAARLDARSDHHRSDRASALDIERGWTGVRRHRIRRRQIKGRRQ